MKCVKGFLLAFLLLAGVGMWVACEKEGSENDGGANHNAGIDCLVCHRANGGGKGVFSAGGTVYKAGTATGAVGATISIFANSDGSGIPVATMSSEVGGNFYTKSSIYFGTGLYVKVAYAAGTSSMMTPITTGACNSCHGVGSVEKITVQ
ncbi:MAG: hypothetical protein NTV01_09940 [Bacteroidia bacterium]|nr:hypothetical protein [Bacteroidia bacterium]